MHADRANLTTDFLGVQIPVDRLEQMKNFNITAIEETLEQIDINVLTVGLDEYLHKNVGAAETARLAEKFQAWARSLFFAQHEHFEGAVHNFDGNWSAEVIVETAIEDAVEAALPSLLRHARAAELSMYDLDDVSDYMDLVPEPTLASPLTIPVSIHSAEVGDFSGDGPPVDLLAVNDPAGDVASVELDSTVPPLVTPAVLAAVELEVGPDLSELSMYGDFDVRYDMYGRPIKDDGSYRTRRTPQRVQVEFVNSAHPPAAPSRPRIPRKHIVPPAHILRPGGAYPFTW